MNIQQLNHNGQNIHIFLITAAVALLITLFLWLAVYLYVNSDAKAWFATVAESQRQIKDLKASHRRGPLGHPRSDFSKPPPKYTLSARLAMIVWLMLNGHTIWMLNSGACLAILLKYQEPGVLSFPDADTGQQRFGTLHTAHEYITTLSRQESTKDAQSPYTTILKGKGIGYDFWPSMGLSGKS